MTQISHDAGHASSTLRLPGRDQPGRGLGDELGDDQLPLGGSKTEPHRVLKFADYLSLGYWTVTAFSPTDLSAAGSAGVDSPLLSAV
jgi:hypothetical protein